MKNLIDVMMHFSDESVCKKYLEKKRWEDGNIICPHCKHDGKIYIMKKNYKCSSCRKQFSVTKGTIFENSAIPLQKWFAAIWLMTSHKKGISSLQLHRDLGVTQKSAWFMLQRIRYAMGNGDNFSLEGTVEVDETYIGGKNKNRHKSKKVKGIQGRSTKDKTAVLGLVERNGRILAMKVDNTTKQTIQPLIKRNVIKGSNIMTDEWKAYKGLEKEGFDHEFVKHGREEYVSGDCHTNTIEGFWSILKRGLYGIHHFVSKKHLNSYIGEFQFRYNTKEMGCEGKFENILSLSNKRLTYKLLING